MRWGSSIGPGSWECPPSPHRVVSPAVQRIWIALLPLLLPTRRRWRRRRRR
jgi:hypothetical protein